MTLTEGLLMLDQAETTVREAGGDQRFLDIISATRDVVLYAVALEKQIAALLPLLKTLQERNRFLENQLSKRGMNS